MDCCSRGKTSSNKPLHKIVLCGDSHIKGLAIDLKSRLTSDFKLISVTKPGLISSFLSETFMETVKDLTNDDMLIICCGSNDYEQDNCKVTFKNIREYVLSLKHTNILVLAIPHRYDLLNSIKVNTEFTKVNRKLSKLMNLLPNLYFLESNNDSRFFTKHGLHRNKHGKQDTVKGIAKLLLSVFNTISLPPIPLIWHVTTEMNTKTKDKDSTKRISNRPRKAPVTRTEDFLW
jgi:hypothetical protein